MQFSADAGFGCRRSVLHSDAALLDKPQDGPATRKWRRSRDLLPRPAFTRINPVVERKGC